MDVRVRVGNGADAEAVARAHVRAWQVAYDGVVPSDYLAALDVAARTDQWRQYLTEAALDNGTPAPRHLVAEAETDGADRRVVGFACIGIWRDEPAAEFGELWALYVHPDHWGGGVGHGLMNDTVENFKSAGVSTAYLWVLEDNPRARTFYERQGWIANDVTKTDVIGGANIVERRYSLQIG